MAFLQHVIVAVVIAVTSFLAPFLGLSQAPKSVTTYNSVDTVGVAPTSSPTAMPTSTGNATLSPLEIHQGAGASTDPYTTTEVYKGDGYTISIPAGFLFDGVLKNYFPWNYVSWHSSGMDQLISVKWQPYSPESGIKRSEDATLRANADTERVVSHPAIAGAASSTMLVSGIYPNAPSGIYLWVTSSNGNIYSVVGLASTPAARATVKQVIQTFSLSIR